MEKEIVTRKNQLILIRILISITLLNFSLSCFSQGEDKDLKEKVWKQEKEYLKYQKKKNYKGPEDWYGSSPSSIKQEEDNYSTTNSGSSQGIQYNPQQLKQNREKQFGKNSGKSGGTLGADPEIQKPDPITLPDFDAPEIDGVVKLLPPDKISKTLKVGEFTKARIVGTQGHDLVALPI